MTDPACLFDDQPLAVVKDHGGKADAIAPCGVTAEVESGVAGEQIDLTGSQRRKSFGGCQRPVLHCGGIANEGSGKGFAEIHVQA